MIKEKAEQARDAIMVSNGRIRLTDPTPEFVYDLFDHCRIDGFLDMSRQWVILEVLEALADDASSIRYFSDKTDNLERWYQDSWSNREPIRQKYVDKIEELFEKVGKKVSRKRILSRAYDLEREEVMEKVESFFEDYEM